MQQEYLSAQSMLAPSGMKVTVCQLHNGRESFAADWDSLLQHVQAERSELVLLPEMPFSPWFPTPRKFDADVWRAALAAHDAWEPRLSQLMPAIALGTRPIDFGNVRYNAGFYWNEEEGIAETIHVKSCLANEQGWWETSWYEGAVPDFEPAKVGSASIGMLIGLELWLLQQAKRYGEDGVHIVAVPRVDRSSDTDGAALEAWLEGGRNAAKASGAYCISSSRGSHADGIGGSGWVLAPDGEPLAVTSPDRLFVSVDLDLTVITDRETSRRAGGPAPGSVRLR
jgi:N-carbamoylputrescine amidase